MSPTTGAGTDIESWLTKQWEEIILVSDIGPDDNLFEVGGTSMHIVDIHSNIVDEFDLLDLSLVDMFEFTTVRSLAAHIHRCLDAKSATTELSGESAGSRPA
jgi:hypothetical protein